jgi:S-adenosylmethionine:tRNA ribosyltransferase-isomerase
MKMADFDYRLPAELIAQHPAQPRDSSRLLVYDRAAGRTTHAVFDRIGGWLRPGDLLVLNDTSVIPSRLYGKKRGVGTGFEFLLLKRLSLANWDVIMKPGKKLRAGQCVDFGGGLAARLVKKKQDGVCEVCFVYDGVFEDLLDKLGHMPLPPYITEKPEDENRYQTVYAKTDGSAAAPTAGLHFTPELLASLEKTGVEIAKVLLHIGLGTFRPMKAETVEDHVMHAEYYSVSAAAADAVNRAKAEGRRVAAVGTTVVRTLESAANEDGTVSPGEGDTGIFIYPGYRFKVTDALLTNFHLPKSTLLMLVSAFAGREAVLELYRQAAEMKYRFFSFGDAMLLV